jgi:anti-repressor protein
MSNLFQVNKMTSMEIAEVTGKRHADIMRDIRDEIEKLEAGGINGERKFALSSYVTDQNKEMPCYIL